MRGGDQAEEAVLEADLSAFSASDALHWATTSRFTGRLRFTRDGQRIDLLLEDGTLVNASTGRVVESLGRHLYSEGLVDEVDLAAAVVYSRDKSESIGRALLDLGVLKPDTLQKALRDHTVNLAELPLEWESGRVTAQPLDLAGRPRIENDAVDLTYLMIEAARRKDELNRVREYLPGESCTLAIGNQNLGEDASGRHRRIVDRLREGVTLGALYEDIGGSYHHFLWGVRQLLKNGVLQIDPSTTGPTSEASPPA